MAGADDMLAGTDPAAFSLRDPVLPGWLDPPPVPPPFGLALAALLEAVDAGGFYDDSDRAAALLGAARREWAAVVEDRELAPGQTAVLVDLDGRVSVDPLQVSGLEKWADQVTIVHLMGSTIRVDRPIDVIRRVLRGQA